MLKIAVSVQAITDKNNFDWSRLRFSERTLTIPEFQTLLEGQYAFNTLRNMPTFSQKLNCVKNFQLCEELPFSSVKVKVAQLCLTLCNPMNNTVHGILQARILEWGAFPVSRGSSQPRD